MAHCGDAGETRTLHPLAHPARISDPGDAELRRGLCVDCETTGFSPGHETVIEFAMLPFTYTLTGHLVEVLHDGAQVHRNDPARLLPAELTHLTGLTDDAVRGERIDVEVTSALVGRSGLVVAHNARFDRPFVERVLPAARARPWACTRAEVPFRRCIASYARTGSTPGIGTAQSMRRRARTPTVRLWAIRSAFETKETLRSWGYRWMSEMRVGNERARWTDVEPDEEVAEFAWLRETVYRGDVVLPAGRRDPPPARGCLRALARGSGRFDGREACLPGAPAPIGV